MKTAPSAFFLSFQLCNNKEETRKITKTAQKQTEQKKKKKRPESLGAAPVFIINSLSNENSRVQLRACAVSTRVRIY